MLIGKYCNMLNMETNSKQIQEKEWGIVPLKPIWEPYNEEARAFLEWFCLHFCNVPNSRKARASYLTVVSSFLALSQQVFNKAHSMMAIPKSRDYWSTFPVAGADVVARYEMIY
jgi:hypothetical protein